MLSFNEWQHLIVALLSMRLSEKSRRTQAGWKPIKYLNINNEYNSWGILPLCSVVQLNCVELMYIDKTSAQALPPFLF